MSPCWWFVSGYLHLWLHWQGWWPIFFTRRLTNESGAVVAGVLTVLAPFYFLRTVAGWFDTDIFIILFPLLVVWLFWESSINKNPRNSIILSILAGFSMFLFFHCLEWLAILFLFNGCFQCFMDFGVLLPEKNP
nr:dolichyl-diphosphooligosaccharide--protein glycosyltransferase subunit STT3 [Methanobacterium formicicum]